mgnify:CR=1 FL=1
MKKFLAIATTIILMSNGQSYAAEKMTAEQSENVKKVQISKENDAGKKFKAQIAELEKEMEELKTQKTSANVPSMDEINEKIFELNEQQKKILKLVERLEKLENEKNISVESTATLVKPSNSKINYTQDAVNSQGNSTMTFYYAPNQLYKIYCRVGYLTDLTLKKGEKINFVGGGDTSAWAVEKATVDGVPHIYIKPTVETSTTNLIITTNKRSYQLILNTSDWYNPMVKWTYAQEEAEENLIRHAKDEQITPVSFETENLNFDYKISGKATEIKPTIVFDDGKRTIIKFEKLPTKLPTLFIKERGKKSISLANYEIKGNNNILEKLVREMELRGSAKEIIKIKRNFKG